MASSLGTIYAELRLKIDGFRQDIQNASVEMKSMQSDMESSMSKLTNVGNGMKDIGKGMSKYVTAPLVGFGTAAVVTGAKFDKAMSEVKAVSGATGEQFDKLREQARQLGSDTAFSASEAAEGMGMLARAGFNTTEIMQAMPGLLDLAAAGAVDLGVASGIVANTMNAFGENADQAGRFADVFAKAAANSDVTVESLGEGMSYAGAAAHAMGMDVETTATILAAFSDAGIKGGRAGTVFEATMRDLKKSAMDSGGALEYVALSGEKVSIAWYDAQGNTRPFLDVLADLEASLDATAETTGKVTQAEKDHALAQLVQTAGLRGMNILLEEGSGNLVDYQESLYGAEGAASEMADTMLDNLAGSFTILKSAIDEVMIGFSDVMAPVIRAVVDKVKDLAVAFGNTSPEMKKVIVVIGLILAAIGPLLVIFGTILTMIPNMVAGWAILKGAMMGIMLPAIKIVAIIAAIIEIGVLLCKNWDKIKEFAGNLWEGVKSGWTDLVEGIKNLFIGIGEFFVGVWDSITTTFSNAFTAIVEWFTSLPERIATGLETFVTAVGTGIENVVTFFSELPGKVLEFLQKLFFEDIPYWVGYGLGTMVRLVMEGIENTVTFFSELPGKVLVFLTELWEYISTKWTKMKETMTRLTKEAIEVVVTFFSGLPGKVLRWLNSTWTNIKTKFDEFKSSMITKTTEAVNKVVEWFAGLPAKIWTWLVNTVTRVTNFGSDALREARKAGQNIIDGVVNTIKELPGLVWGVFTSVGGKMTEAGSALWNKARGAGSRIWEGFKAGMGIRSPSYLEEAMFDIMDESKHMLGVLGSVFRKLGSMKVKPPSLGGISDSFKEELGYLFGDEPEYAFESSFGMTKKQIIEHVHSGVLEVRGVTEQGQVLDVVEIVKDELRREVRT